MATTLDTLDIKIRVDSNEADKKLKETKDNVEELSKASSSVKNVAKQLGLGSIANGSVGISTGKHGKWDKALSNGSKLSEIINRKLGIDNAKLSAKESAKVFEEALGGSNGIELSSIFDKMSAGIPAVVGGLKKVVSFFQMMLKFASSVVSVIGKIGSALGGIASKVFGGITSKIKGIFKTVSKFKSSILRIGFYRLIRTAIQKITQAFKEGMENVYMFSKSVKGEFADSMDLMTTKSATMKNQLGSAFASLLNAVMPVILKLISLVTRLANALTMLFSAFSGKTSWTKAVDSAQSFKEATGGAASSAKELKKTIMGFDEINALNDNSDSSGGGSGSSFGAFEESALPEWLTNLINNGEWKLFGETIADKINEAVNKINAKKIAKNLAKKINNILDFSIGFLEKINTTNIGNKLGEFVGTLFNEINPENIGRVIGLRIQRAFDFVGGYLNGMKSTKASTGKWIAGIVNGWFNAIDFNSIGRTIGDGIKYVFDNINSFFSSVNWDNIANSISEFISGVDFKGVIDTIGNCIKSVITNDSFIDVFARIGAAFLEVSMYLVEWVRENITYESLKSFVSEFTTKMANALGYDNSGEMWDAVATSIQDAISWVIKIGLQAVTDLVASGDIFDILLTIGKTLAGGIVQGFKEAFQPETTDDMWADLERKMGASAGLSKTKDSAKTYGEDIGKFCAEGFDNGLNGTSTVTDAVTDFTDNYKDTLEGELDINSPSKYMDNIGVYLIDGLLNGFEEAWGKFLTKMRNDIYSFKTFWENFSVGAFKIKLPHLSVSWQKVNSTFAKFFGISSLPSVSVSWYANGGFPDAGQLFIANENGAEMVGSMDGRTAVANNEQIIEGIRRGVTEAMMNVMSSTNGRQDIRVYLDSREIKAGQRRLSMAMGV